VRAVTSVVNVSNIDVAEGIWHCVSEGADVVTLSVGGYVNPWLERVVSFAVFRDVVVVAAAGQIWPFVVAPACYPDCIAVTASDVRSRHWELASSGPQIDVAAPGVDVY
jgi:subtilisin family serine protease